MILIAVIIQSQRFDGALVQVFRMQLNGVGTAVIPGSASSRLFSDVILLGFQLVLPFKCIPHSLVSGFSHHHLPLREGSPFSTARVHGAHPILR